jgi:DNA-binding MarR family transcriptional regulator
MSHPLEKTFSTWMALIMHNSLGNFLRFAKDKNLSLAQLHALTHLSHHEGCSVSGMGSEFGVTNAAISQLLEKLVQQGYVTRSEDPLDRRNKILEVTDGGRKIATEAILERQKWISQVVYILSEEEKQQVEDTLQLLINKVIQLNENEH